MPLFPRRFLAPWVLALATCVLSIGTHGAAAEVDVYPLPACYTASDQWQARAGSALIPVTAFSAIYDYCHFGCPGPVTLTLTASEDIAEFSVYPKSLAIPAQAKGRTLSLVLNQPACLIVKINHLRELAIAADTAERDAPSPSGPKVHSIAPRLPRSGLPNITSATAEIQQAINAAAQEGGGTVYVPPGVYRIANLTLKSHVALYLAPAAVLQASPAPADYAVHYHKDSLKMDGTWLIATEPGATDVRIYGRGVIDGNGRTLRQAGHFLTNLVVPLQCSHFTIEGVVLRDSGLWGLIPTRSDHVTIRDTKHFNENDALYEDDAVDIIECQDVSVQHVLAIAEDDTFSTKTWEKPTDIAVHWPGEPEPLANVTFDDCLAWSRCATFKVGFGNFQPQRDIVFKNCCSYQSMRALAVNHNWGEQPAERIAFENIEVDGFWPRRGSGSRWLEITSGSNGPVRDVSLKNIQLLDTGEAPAVLKGKSASGEVTGVHFTAVQVKGRAATTLTDLNVAATNEFVRGVKIEAEAP